jgi:hypothetical protein
LAKLFHSFTQGEAAMVVIAKDILRHEGEGNLEQDKNKTKTRLGQEGTMKESEHVNTMRKVGYGRHDMVKDTMQRKTYDAVIKTIAASKTS